MALNNESAEFVLIPFLSGLFFQPEMLHRCREDVSLNPLSIGSVFPTYQWDGFWHRGKGLNPLSIGSVFPTIMALNNESAEFVLIPFLSGLFFQPEMLHRCREDVSLNPLSIGSVFPTYQWDGFWHRGKGLNPLSIGSVFPTKKKG